MHNRIKNNLLVIVLSLLALPFIQQCVPFVHEDWLMGYYNITNDTPFSFDQWFDGSYQQKKESFVNDRVGFRPGFVRLKDQVDYSIFSKINYGGAVLGKKNDFYYIEYILAYNGHDYSSNSFIRAKLLKLKALQDTFSRLGKTMVVC
ncbi:MAG: sugar O-acetyltransferase precursor [Flavipsychrobacter sp.]|nr:sugar O-acetyltransferase precursor [Flavipsychrobacter sp.]